MFADVVGSTALAEELDPEDWTTIMNAAFERISRPIYAYEGTIARLMGDALLAFFGAPVGHEDDPERAVRAGLDLLSEVRQFADEVRDEYGIEFQMRVGINTGDVVVGEVGSDLAYEYTAMGDAINLAARMEQTARPGIVQISEFTYKFIAPLFEVEQLGDIHVKGKRRAVQAYAVLRPKSAPDRTRGIAGLNSPIVGRQREIRTLQKTISATLSGRGQIVGLIGEAGLGKSRMIEEVIREWKAQAQSASDLVIYRGVSFERERPYGIFRRSLLEQFGVGEQEPPELIIEAMVRAAGPDAEVHNSFRKFAAAVKGLLRLSSDDADSNRALEGETFKQELFEGILSPIRHRLKVFPTLFILDDLHWADPASVELVGQILAMADDYPCMFMFATRPERSSPGWRLVQTAELEFHHRYRAIALGRLSPEASGLLIANLLEIDAMPEAVRAAINDKAEGNPFFIEEILRSLLESGAIEQENGKARWRGGSVDASIELPDNVNALLTARIDRLEPHLRRTLQLAAVIGRHFSKIVLEQISDWPEEVRNHLNIFERQGLVVPTDNADRFGFRHDLTREAAYGSILKKQRPRLHQHVGEVMEEIFAQQLVEQAPLLARHFAQAGDRQKGREYALLAGQEAARIHAVSEAIHFFGQALEHSKRLKLPLAEQAPIYSRLGRSLELASRFEEAFTLYDELDRLANRDGEKPLRLEAMLGKATLRVIANTYYDPVEGKQLLEQASRLADEVGDAGSRAKILWQLMLLDISTDMDVEARLRYGEEALELARSVGQEELTAFILHDLWYAYGGSGQWARALEALEEACEIWQELGNKPMLSESLLRRSLSYQAMGQNEQAIRYSEEAFAYGLQSNNADQKAISRSLIGTVYVERGDWMRAIEIMEETIEYGRTVTNVTACIGTRSDLALLYLELGQTGRALALVEEALEVPFEILIPFARAARIELLVHQGQLEEAALEGDRLVNSSEQKRKLGAMTPIWVRAGLAHTKLCLAQGDWAGAARHVEALIRDLQSEDLHFMLVEALYLRGLILLAEHERLDEAQEALANAWEEAQQQGSKRTLWKILAALSDLAQRQGDEKKAAAYRQQAAVTIRWIVDGLKDEELRRSYLARPEVKAIYDP